MSVPCVVLASEPKGGADWTDFASGLRGFNVGPANVDGGYQVFFTTVAAQDGGNGGGGEPGGTEMRLVLGVQDRGAWDFQAYKQADKWKDRFPLSMRFDVCLPFEDISEASKFLHTDLALGKKIMNNFTYVMIVPMSQRAP